jgi:hypothetical protein
MKPIELASAVTSKTDFNQNDCYELNIRWDDGKLEYCELYKIKFGESRWHDCKDMSEFEKIKGEFNLPQTHSYSHGCLTISYNITPQRHIDMLHSKIVDGICACIKVYEKQLKSELDKTLKSISLIKAQK